MSRPNSSLAHILQSFVQAEGRQPFEQYLQFYIPLCYKEADVCVLLTHISSFIFNGRLLFMISTKSVKSAPKLRGERNLVPG